MSKIARAHLIEDFLARHGLRKATQTALAGDASFRSYQRIVMNGKTFVLMDAPPEKEDVKPFASLSAHLVALGFSAPRVLAQDEENGLLLLEDLGDDTFSQVLARNPTLRSPMYETAIDVLGELHRTQPPKGLQRYDLELLFEELFLFPRWYLPALLGVKNPVWEKDLQEICSLLFKDLQQNQDVLVLRDYHADNLMWLSHRHGIARVGLLDFQDGVAGHRAYDLVSLLQDARQPYDKDFESAMIDRYALLAGKKFERESFMTAYQVLGAQRNAKIIGIFTRLWKRDGKPAYPKMITHVWTLLEENLKHPALAALKDWMDITVPASLRTKNLI